MAIGIEPTVRGDGPAEGRFVRPVPAHPDERHGRADFGRRRELVWLGSLVLVVLLAGALPLLRTPRFYFYGDTQAGAVGQWYYLGQQLLSAHWPALDPQIWRGGNFIAEGQAGLFSPLTMLIALLIIHAGNLLVFTTVLKLLLLIVGALGTYALTRSYGAPAWAAFVAGLSVTIGGTTRYLESPSWVTGQMIWALLPVFWWCLRRMLRTGANPLGALVSGFLIVTVGYVYGCLYIGLVVLACIIDALLARQRTRALAMLGVGVCCALLAVTVYLPGVLTAPVTIRTGIGIVSDGRLSGEPLGMAIGFLIFPGAASFVAWFIPVLAWLNGRKAAAVARSLAGLGIFTVLVTLWILGPNQIGPIRWPIRVMPEFVLPVVVGICVLLGRARRAPVGAGRLMLALAWVVAGGWLAASRVWTSAGAVATSSLLVAVGLSGIWLLWRLGERRWRQIRLPADGLTAAFVAVWTLIVLAVQYAYVPTPPSVDRNLPALAADYRGQASASIGDTIVVGDSEADLVAQPDLSRQILVANSWFLNPQSVQSTYTTTSFAAYSSRYCIRYNGNSCPQLLQRLFTKEPTTGQLRVDLLSISTVLIYRPSVSPAAAANPPRGWRVADTTSATITWVRDEPLPAAGGVAWTDDDLRLSEVSRTSTSVHLRVDAVGAGGGTVVLSRMAWPGYAVAGGTLAPPTDSYLLTVRVPPGAAGSEVVVNFEPPGWGVERATLVVSLLALVLWSLAHAVLTRTTRRRHSTRPADR